MVGKIGDEGGDCSLADEQRCKILVPIKNPLQILHKSMKNYLKLKMLVDPFCPKKRSRRKGITVAFSITFNLWYVSFTNPSPLSKLSPNFSSQTALKFSPLSSDFIFKLKAQILEAIGVDYVDESEVFVCGCRNLGEALRRIREGATMFLRFRSILLSSWFR